MKIITPGHVYELDNFENREAPNQTIGFIHKEKNEQGELVTISDGTTNEEVLAVLIDRIQFLDSTISSEHNQKALRHLLTAAEELKLRTADREERGVEGTPEA